MSKQSLLKGSSNASLSSRAAARLRLTLSMRIAICILAATATAIGCGWFGPENSIRFNGFKSERQMGRLPPLPTLANGKTEISQSQSYEEETDDDSEPDFQTWKRRTEEADALWDQAEAAETSGALWRTRELLREYLERTSVARDPGLDPKDRQQRRNSAIDRQDALSALDEGTRESAVQSYLNARRAYDAQASGEDVERSLTAISTDERLRDNAAYLRAAMLYRDERKEDAVRDFKALASRYPRSEKREAALYMAALVTMKMSSAFTPTSGDEAHRQAGDEQQSETHEAEPIRLVNCCDEAWAKARAAFERVMREYPRGRYQRDARGWLAYLRLRGNDRAGALVEYYRMLGDEKDMNARLEGAFSLTLVRHHASDDEMGRVEKELEDEPAAALAYAYHNIYNYAIDPGCQLQYDWSGNVWEAKEYAATKRRIERAELQRVAAFATRLMRRYPSRAVGGQFALRVAEANLELGEHRSATEQAKLALTLNLRNEERANALWVKAVAEHRLRDYDSAWNTFNRLLDERSDGKLTEGARRHLAMIAEDRGDLEAALEQYLALEYDSDVAYFVDVLMTPEQLAGFIERHPNHEKRDQFLYALGLRHLRARRWDDARVTLSRIKMNEKGDYDRYSDYERCSEFRFACVDPKGTYYGVDLSGGLLMRDIKTADDLQRLEREAEIAKGDEAKAEALYQLASYQYEASTLLFYNPVAWQGTRYWLLSELEGSGSYRAPNEPQILWQYMQEHEGVARALVIYLEIVRRFPKTRAARDALYTAAVCHERLSDFNPYWRDMYRRGLHAGERMVTYEDVRRTYPDYQLPRGTRRWEPSTRTVNGGAGWAARPKPQPRPTWRARLKLKLAYVLRRIISFWEQTGRRWLVIWLGCAGPLFAAHVATRAHRQRAKNTRHKM